MKQMTRQLLSAGSLQNKLLAKNFLIYILNVRILHVDLYLQCKILLQ